MNNIAQFVDLTNLATTATPADISALCEVAKKYKYKSVCVHGSYVPQVAECLKGTNVITCTVIGFPMGMMNSSAKYLEASLAVDGGATELDVVLNIGRYKAGEYDYITSEIMAILGLGVVVKVIIETALLSDSEIEHCSGLLKGIGVHYVKTSTGYSIRGASENDISIMRRVSGCDMAVKASGGIRDLDKAIAMLEAGADRIGASANLALAAENAEDATRVRLANALDVAASRNYEFNLIRK